MSTPFRAAACLAAALVSLLAAAAPAPLPDGFGIAPRHEMVPAVWSTTVGESPSAWSRATVQGICAAKRSTGATTHTPVFEADPDRPNAVRIVQVAGARDWVSYETVQGAMCDAATLRTDLCACTFRLATSRYMHLRRTRDGVTEIFDIDLAKGSATRRTRRATQATDAAPAGAAGFFGPVVGHDAIAGMPCSLRRQDLATGYIERCLADAVTQVPVALQGQELSSAAWWLRDGAPVRRDWRRTERVQADAEVDAGVFDVPAGVTLRDLGGAAARP